MHSKHNHTVHLLLQLAAAAAAAAADSISLHRHTPNPKASLNQSDMPGASLQTKLAHGAMIARAAGPAGGPEAWALASQPSICCSSLVPRRIGKCSR
jgi:hypothetical protein